MCLFSFSIFSQKNKTNTKFKQPQNKTTTIKKTFHRVIKCDLCNGSGKDPICKGTGICKNHNANTYLKESCFKDCTEDCFEDEDCIVICGEDCTETSNCLSCGNMSGYCSQTFCKNGVCTKCKGTGKLQKK